MPVKAIKCISDKFDLSIDFSPMINVLVGQNGSGKTLILKANWALCYILYCISSYVLKGKMKYEDLIRFTLDNTFEQPSLVDIELGLLFEATKNEGGEGKKVDIQLEIYIDPDGNIRHNIDDIDKDFISEVPVFHSKDMRLFSQKDIYLSFRNSVTMKDAKEELTQTELQILLKTFKLYDILAVEKLIQICPIEVTPKYVELFETYTDESGKNFMEKYIGYSLDVIGNNFVFYNKIHPDKTIRISSMAAGYQAVLTMHTPLYENIG